MSNTSDKLREFCENWRSDLIKHGGIPEMLSDLTALISEGYVSKEKAGYPLEFIEWLIKDQEIFFGELSGEYILNDNIRVNGRKPKTIDELFNYWRENEQC